MIYRNPHAEYKNPIDKCHAFLDACRQNALAYRADGTTVQLQSLKPSDVEFIAGLWRVQTKLNIKISNIRDRQLILGPRIDLQEKNYFEYYRAAKIPTYNCYGPLDTQLRYDVVVAKYITDKGVYWAYGDSIAQARAFLGIKLYDEYMDLIHRTACRNINLGKNK